MDDIPLNTDVPLDAEEQPGSPEVTAGTVGAVLGAARQAALPHLLPEERLAEALMSHHITEATLTTEVTAATWGDVFAALAGNDTYRVDDDTYKAALEAMGQTEPSLIEQIAMYLGPPRLLHDYTMSHTIDFVLQGAANAGVPIAADLADILRKAGGDDGGVALTSAVDENIWDEFFALLSPKQQQAMAADDGFLTGILHRLNLPRQLSQLPSEIWGNIAATLPTKLGDGMARSLGVTPDNYVRDQRRDELKTALLTNDAPLQQVLQTMFKDTPSGLPPMPTLKIDVEGMIVVDSEWAFYVVRHIFGYSPIEVLTSGYDSLSLESYPGIHVIHDRTVSTVTDSMALSSFIGEHPTVPFKFSDFHLYYVPDECSLVLDKGAILDSTNKARGNAAFQVTVNTGGKFETFLGGTCRLNGGTVRNAMSGIMNCLAPGGQIYLGKDQLVTVIHGTSRAVTLGYQDAPDQAPLQLNDLNQNVTVTEESGRRVWPLAARPKAADQG